MGDGTLDPRQALRAMNTDGTDDFEYLLGLLAEVLDDEEHFENDRERAEWAIAQWCQELLWEPDLRAYETGQMVPYGPVEDRKTAIRREAREAEEDEHQDSHAGKPLAEAGGPFRDV